MSKPLFYDISKSKIELNVSALQCAQWLTVAIAFFIPISTSLTSIALILFFICWLKAGNIKNRCIEICQYPLSQATCIFLCLFMLGALYAGYSKDIILRWVL